MYIYLYIHIYIFLYKCTLSIYIYKYSYGWIEIDANIQLQWYIQTILDEKFNEMKYGFCWLERFMCVRFCNETINNLYIISFIFFVLQYNDHIYFHKIAFIKYICNKKRKSCVMINI